MIKWLGHILREGSDKLTFKAVEEQSRMFLPGNLLKDAPPHVTIGELAIKTKDHVYWRGLTAHGSNPVNKNMIYPYPIKPNSNKINRKKKDEMEIT